MKKILVLLVVLAFIASPAYCDPKKATPAAEKPGAGERIANETADAVADVLTGEDTKTPAKGNMPPGLAKKDKTPPGWDKGQKTGWDKEEKPQEDSLIKKIVKGIFGQGDKEKKAE